MFLLLLALGAGLLRFLGLFYNFTGPGPALGGLFFLVRRLVVVGLLLVVVVIPAQVLSREFFSLIILRE